MGSEKLSEYFFEESELCESTNFPDDIFSVLESLENNQDIKESFEFQVSSSAYNNSPLMMSFQESETDFASPRCKKQKLMNEAYDYPLMEEGQQRINHITVERNRRKQMNEHLTVLRSLMPCFYVKRGDQASIIDGVVNYITELQQILQSLEATKQRKIYTDVLSPRSIPSPHPSPLSPRKPPISPRLTVNISPRAPQSSGPYKTRLQTGYLNSTSLPSPVESSSSCSTSSINDSINELVASSRSAMAEVEVNFSGPNLLLKTISNRISGQAVKIISALEELELEILQVNINTVDERMLNSFTIKIGIECQLSAEDLAQQIQKTFC